MSKREINKTWLTIETMDDNKPHQIWDFLLESDIMTGSLEETGGLLKKEKTGVFKIQVWLSGLSASL